MIHQHDILIQAAFSRRYKPCRQWNGLITAGPPIENVPTAPAKRDRSRNMKTSGKAPDMPSTCVCKCDVGDGAPRSICEQTGRVVCVCSTQPRASHTYWPHPHTRWRKSPRQVAFYIFIPRSPFFSPLPCLATTLVFRIARELGERTDAQSATPLPNPFLLPAVVETLAGDGISHSKPSSALRSLFHSPLIPLLPPCIARISERISGRNIKHGSRARACVCGENCIRAVCWCARSRVRL